jgi:hypothetical protein
MESEKRGGYMSLARKKLSIRSRPTGGRGTVSSPPSLPLPACTELSPPPTSHSSQTTLHSSISCITIQLQRAVKKRPKKNPSFELAMGDGRDKRDGRDERDKRVEEEAPEEQSSYMEDAPASSPPKTTRKKRKACILYTQWTTNNHRLLTTSYDVYDVCARL